MGKRPNKMSGVKRLSLIDFPTGRALTKPQHGVPRGRVTGGDPLPSAEAGGPRPKKASLRRAAKTSGKEPSVTICSSTPSCIIAGEKSGLAGMIGDDGARRAKRTFPQAAGEGWAACQGRSKSVPAWRQVSHLVCEEGGPWAPFLGCGLTPLGRSLEALLVCLSAVSYFA